MDGFKALRCNWLRRLPATVIFWFASLVLGGASFGSSAMFGDNRVAVRVAAVTATVLLSASALLCVVEAMAAWRMSVRCDGDVLRVRPLLLPWAGMAIPLTAIRDVRQVKTSARPWRSVGWWRPGAPGDAVLDGGGALAVDA